MVQLGIGENGVKKVPSSRVGGEPRDWPGPSLETHRHACWVGLVQRRIKQDEGLWLQKQAC
jgi:hypothetical protein